ncbi:MAG: serine/threonine-protein kinase, partial [Acidobacteria bacterium]|nr:serine/threonine-protein kinase [Acidobacteriota bacterium]
MSSDSGQTTSVRSIGRYRAFDELGRGAMGIVYRGFDPVIGRTVALKTIVLDTSDAQAKEFRDRLYREAAAAGALSHPNIVTIFDIIEDGTVTAVAMEFIEGRSLAAIIAERAPLPLDLAVEIFEQICSALDYAGSHGIVHRDIKPANILMTAAGRAKVTDFGVARLALSTMTQAGTVLGSPSYMSPEQVRGLPLDGRSDLFSAAVVFYEMITRERPFAGNDVATTMYRIAHEPPTPPGHFNAAIGPAVTAVLERALAKLPDQRFRTGA